MGAERTMTLEQLVQRGRDLRDQKKRVDEKAKQVTAGLDREMASVHAQILTIMKETGQESARTAAGTATLSRKRLIGLAGEDNAWEKLCAHAAKHNAWHLIQKRPADGGCKEWEQEHGSLPPGTGIVRDELVVGIRAPTARRK